MSLGVLIKVISGEGWGQNASRVRCEEIDDGEQEGNFETFWHKAEQNNAEIARGESREFCVGGINNASANSPVRRKCFMT